MAIHLTRTDELALVTLEIGTVDAHQADGCIALAILMEQVARRAKDLGVYLRGVIQRACARDGGEVRVPQLQLDRTGKQRMFAEAATHHFREPR